MSKLLKEPLLYFLLLGAGFFLLYEQVADDASANSDLQEIVVTAGHIKSLLLGFEKTWQRSPSQQERDGLIESFIHEEVLYREALAMGLDRDDAIVRRRLSQKMGFLTADLVGPEVPDDEMLQVYLDANAQAYRLPSRFSFRQVYLDASQRGESVEDDALALLAQLRSQDTDVANLGDSLMIKSTFENETDSEVERTLGLQFLQRLQETETGSWQGPIISGYGFHLIYISKRSEGLTPKLSVVRDAVLRDWLSQARKKLNAEFYNVQRERYKVTVADFKFEPDPLVTMTKAKP